MQCSTLLSEYLNNLPKEKTSKLKLVKGNKEMAKEQNTNTNQGKKREFKEVSSNYATPWKPTEGESIEGYYKGFDMIPGERNEKFRSHRILQEGKEEPMGVSGAMIDTKMVRIPKNTYVRITYKGKEHTRNGMAHSFIVECEKGTVFLENDNEPDQDFT